jgi:hypothetical protein
VVSGAIEWGQVSPTIKRVSSFAVFVRLTICSFPDENSICIIICNLHPYHHLLFSSVSSFAVFMMEIPSVSSFAASIRIIIGCFRPSHHLQRVSDHHLHVSPYHRLQFSSSRRAILSSPGMSVRTVNDRYSKRISACSRYSGANGPIARYQRKNGLGTGQIMSNREIRGDLARRDIFTPNVNADFSAWLANWQSATAASIGVVTL